MLLTGVGLRTMSAVSGSQKKALDPTELELHLVVSHLTRVLETKFGYSAKTGSTLRH